MASFTSKDKKHDKKSHTLELDPEKDFDLISSVRTSTRDTISGFVVREEVGMLESGMMESTSIASDIITALGGMFGGRSHYYTALLESCTEDALFKLKKRAAERGADGVLQVRFQTTTTMNRMIAGLHVSVLAYGTAVKLEKDS